MFTTVRSSGWLAGRSLLLVRRVPSVFIPAMVMPLFILVATAGAFHGIGQLPAFQGASYLRFTVPMAVTMGAGFAGINAGMTMARDVEGGFFARLAATPTPRLALVVGPLFATVVRSLFTTTVVFVAASLANIGPPGLWDTLLVAGLAAGFAVVAACWSLGVAFRARSIQSAPLMQVVVFLSVFTSVAYTPRSALTGWLRRVADVNPVTRILEASRQAEISGATWAKTWPGLVALAVLLAIAGTFALAGLTRLTRD